MTLLHYSPPTEPFLDVVYHDQDIVVVNKPSGLLSVPGKAPQHRDSSWSRLAWVYPDLRVIHRLDMATSGLMVFALHKQAQANIQRQFEQRTVKKLYRATVWGRPPAAQGTIELPVRCDWPNRPRQMVDLVAGKSALTFYRVLEYHDQTTSIELEPYTGRSHQLRVHMQALGTAILGDKFYAGVRAFAAAPRLLLHAQHLAFYHPRSGERVAFTIAADF